MNQEGRPNRPSIHRGIPLGGREFRWAPYLVGVGIGILTLMLWQGLNKQVHGHIEQTLTSEAAHIKTMVLSQLESRILSLIRMADRWAIQGGTPRAVWESDVKNYMDHQPGYQAIEWVDPSFHVRWIVPLKGNESAQDLNLAFEENRRTALERARDHRKVTVSRPVDLVQEGKGFLLYVPIFSEDRFGGFMLGVFRIQDFFDTILSHDHAPGYSIVMFAGEEEVYRRAASDQLEQEWGLETAFDLDGTPWQIKIWPYPNLLTTLESTIPIVVLLGGFAIAFLFTRSIQLTQTARRRADEVEVANRELKIEVSDRKQAEGELQESQRAFSTLLSNLPGMAYRCQNDSDWSLEFVSEGSLPLTGYTPADLLGKKVSYGQEVVHPDDHQRIWNEVQAALNERKAFRLMYRIRTADGRVRWVWEQGRGIFSSENELLCLEGFVTDITERKQAETELEQQVNARTSELEASRTAALNMMEDAQEARKKTEEANQALNESQERVRLLLDSTAEAIYGLDKVGNCTFANSACVKTLGYKDANDLLGKDMHQLIHHTRPDQTPYPESQCAIYQSYLRGTGIHIDDEVLWRADGTSFPAEYWSYPVIRDGEIMGTVVTFLDITERKRVEDAFRSMVKGVSMVTGEAFFRSLARHLTSALNVRWAFIAKQTDSKEKSARTIAFWSDGKIHDNFEYGLKGTPCENVVGKELCFYPMDVQELFPEDPWLREQSVESYLAIPLFDSSGQSLGHLAVMHDRPMNEHFPYESILTIFAARVASELERSHAEEKLQLTQFATDRGADPAFWMSPDGRFFYVNNAACCSLGYSREELLNLGVSDIDPDYPSEGWPETWKKVKEQATFSFESRHRRKDGSIYPVEITVNYLEFQGKEYNCAFAHDISGRKRAEDALQASQIRLSRILDIAEDAIISVDHSHRIRIFNRGAEMIFGYPAQEILGQPLDLLLPLRYMEQHRQHIGGFAKSPEVARKMGERQEIFGRRKDGTEFPAEASISKFDWQGEKVFTVILRDITEQKQKESQITQSLREKEILLKEVHHRVKNNLQVISSLLNLQAGYVHDSQAREVFKDSQNRVRSMALVHETLYQSEDLSKMAFARYIQKLVTHLFDSYKINSDLIALKINIGNVFLPIDTAIPCGLIVNELVSNSLKYAFPSKRNGEIHIDLHPDSHQQFILTVKDNGVGLPQDLDLRNLESLGLQLVCTLTEQLEGTLKLHRTGGTTFKITFKAPAAITTR